MSSDCGYYMPTRYPVPTLSDSDIARMRSETDRKIANKEKPSPELSIVPDESTTKENKPLKIENLLSRILIIEYIMANNHLEVLMSSVSKEDKEHYSYLVTTGVLRKCVVKKGVNKYTLREKDPQGLIEQFRLKVKDLRANTTGHSSRTTQRERLSAKLFILKCVNKGTFKCIRDVPGTKRPIHDSQASSLYRSGIIERDIRATRGIVYTYCGNNIMEDIATIDNLLKEA